MKITEIRAYTLDAALKQNFSFSQWEFSRRSTMLVEISTDSGIHGWGEAYGPAQPAASAIADYFAPLLMGRDPRDTEANRSFRRPRAESTDGLSASIASAISLARIGLPADRKKTSIRSGIVLSSEVTGSSPFKISLLRCRKLDAVL